MRSPCVAALFCIAAFTFFPLSACQTTQQAPTAGLQVSHSIKKGMTPTQVRAVLGEPVRVEKKNGAIKWMVYGTRADRTLIYFEGGVVKKMP